MWTAFGSLLIAGFWAHFVGISIFLGPQKSSGTNSCRKANSYSAPDFVNDLKKGLPKPAYPSNKKEYNTTSNKEIPA